MKKILLLIVILNLLIIGFGFKIYNAITPREFNVVLANVSRLSPQSVNLELIQIYSDETTPSPSISKQSLDNRFFPSEIKTWKRSVMPDEASQLCVRIVNIIGKIPEGSDVALTERAMVNVPESSMKNVLIAINGFFKSEQIKDKSSKIQRDE